MKSLNNTIKIIVILSIILRELLVKNQALINNIHVGILSLGFLTFLVLYLINFSKISHLRTKILQAIGIVLCGTGALLNILDLTPLIGDIIFIGGIFLFSDFKNYQKARTAHI